MFQYRRPLPDICYNLLPGKVTVGARDTEVSILVHMYC